MINRNEYLDDYGTEVDPLFDIVDKLQQERDELKAHVSELINGLNRLTSGSCDCDTKTPEIQYHNDRCTYKRITKLIETTPAQSLAEIQAKAIENAIKNFTLPKRTKPSTYGLGVGDMCYCLTTYANKLRSEEK